MGEMMEIDACTFSEENSREECLAVVRTDGTSVMLMLARGNGGSLEVSLPVDAAERLARGLTIAVEEIGEG